MGVCNVWENVLKTDISDRSGQGGFTLIEIMIAVCVLSIGLLAVASMQTNATQRTASSRWNTNATVWASDRIEKIISLPYNHPDLINGNHGPVTEDQYSINWSVADNSLIPNTKTISVTVNWDDAYQSRDLLFTFHKADI